MNIKKDNKKTTIMDLVPCYSSERNQKFLRIVWREECWASQGEKIRNGDIQMRTELKDAIQRAV